MKYRFIIIVLVCLFSVMLIGCTEYEDPNKIISIEMESSDFSDKILKSQVFKFLDSLGVVLNYADESTDVIPFSKDMISESDYLKLFTVGKHTVIVEYKGLQTQFTVEVYEQTVEYYTVKVFYPDGTPAKDVVVNWIKDKNYVKSSTVDENGIAQIIDDGNVYHIRLKNLPSRYTFNPNSYIINENVKNIEVQLLELSEFVEGTGSKNDPIFLSTGIYEVTFDESSVSGIKIFAIKHNESGKLTVESMAEEKFPSNPIDPYFGFLGEKLDFSSVDYSGNQESYVNINFKYSFDIEAGKTYYFIIFVSTADTYPATFKFSISK